jgi:hypothetical protein
MSKWRYTTLTVRPATDRRKWTFAPKCRRVQVKLPGRQALGLRFVQFVEFAGEILKIYSVDQCGDDPCDIQQREVKCSVPGGPCAEALKPLEVRQCGVIQCGNWTFGNWSEVRNELMEKRVRMKW